MAVLRIAGIMLIALGLAWIGNIFALTEQAPAETSGLSSSVKQKLVGIDVPDVSRAADAASGEGCCPASPPLACEAFSVASVRQWAHAAEFFVPSVLFAGGTVLLHIGFR